jgi:hypothetical protein
VNDFCTGPVDRYSAAPIDVRERTEQYDIVPAPWREYLGSKDDRVVAGVRVGGDDRVPQRAGPVASAIAVTHYEIFRLVHLEGHAAALRGPACQGEPSRTAQKQQRSNDRIILT